MDIVKVIKGAAVFATAILLMLFATVPASRVNAAMPLSYVYDNANLLTNAEKSELVGLASEYSALLDVHFIVLTINDDHVTDLESYTRNFFEENIAGVGGVYECAILTVNMGTRRVAVDFFGELRTMISDSEATVIREGLTPDMTGGDYGEAARYFLDEAAGMVKDKYALYHMDTPFVDAGALVYDFAGALSGGEYDSLCQAAWALSDEMGVGHIIVIMEGWESEEYLKQFASSFYKQNFKEADFYDGAFILAVSVENKQAAVSPFGSYMPENSLLRSMESEADYKLRYYSLYECCMYFLVSQADEWQATHFEMPVIDPTQKIYDYTGVLSSAEIGSLQALINERRDKYGVDFMIIVSDIPLEKTLRSFQYQFYDIVSDYERDNTRSNYVTLMIGAPPVLPSDMQHVSVSGHGSKVYKKIGFNQGNDARKAAYYEVINNGDYYAACKAFIDVVSKAMSSPIPDVRMIDDLVNVAQISLLMGLGLSTLILLILRIIHGFGMKREISAGNYIVNESFKLYYAKDKFLHSHTSKTRRSSESSSDSGGSGGSSGGGTSSRSEGGF